ncbi:MAG: endonuclease/exonuclease/phosphatase family protein [Pyrinomonadaceae bacterium]
MNLRRRFPTFVVVWIALCVISPHRAIARSASNDIFTVSELNELYNASEPSAELEQRLRNVLNNPYVGSFADAARPRLSRSAELGEFIRVAQWNIENGTEFDAIAAAFESDERVIGHLDAVRFPEGSNVRSTILEQARLLRAADVIILNEVDWGVARSGYRDVARDLAQRLGMHYAYGVGFVELSPVYMSQKLDDAATRPKELNDAVKIDPERYRGFHGTAILSRFPLSNVKLTPFDYQPYDWFEDEKKGVSFVDKFRRTLVKQVFLEDALRQVRRGGRMMLTAEITDPSFPAGRITIVATHLENRTSPKLRERQLRELLDNIKDIRGPVVVAGDMNTSGSDMTPTTLERELNKRFGKAEYWAKTGLNYLLGTGLIQDAAIASLTFGRNHGDPTVRHIPVLMPNEERKFFSTLKAFRFADKGVFDFRGEAARSSNGRRNTFANSNERDEKGFVTTFRLQRPVKFIGKFKLDWIFVKPVHLFDPSDYQGSYLLAPHFGRTLDAVNSISPERISDHSPLIVDLPLTEPPLPKKARK